MNKYLKRNKKKVKKMKGKPIFLTFFLFFTLVSIIVPIPLFPGNMIPIWLGIQTNEYSLYLNALINGITYGFIVWLIFVIGVKQIEKVAAKNREKESAKTPMF